jgi:hypothetical protein
MGAYGELFRGRKVNDEGVPAAPGREHDPGGPLDLDRGVVYLAPRERRAESAPDLVEPDDNK